MKRGWLCAALAAMVLAGCGSGEARDEGESEPDSVATTEPARPTTSADSWPEGIYGNVFMSAETGDLGGFEVRFYKADGRNMAEFVLCEGWCSETFHAEVTRDGAGFVFEHVEELISGERIEPHQVRYRLTPEGEGLALESWYDGKKLPWDDGDPLPRIAQPFGLNVANEVP